MHHRCVGSCRVLALAAAVGAMLLCANSATAANVWTGSLVNFTKADFTDPTLPSNQDRLTPNVWITRADLRGIYNARTETSFTHFLSPADTEWANGSLANFNSLTYTDWNTWALITNNGPPLTIGVDAVVHLISEDTYLSITFTSWSAAGGGGFSYSRSTPVPAPASLALLGVGGLIATRRHRRV